MRYLNYLYLISIIIYIYTMFRYSERMFALKVKRLYFNIFILFLSILFFYSINKVELYPLLYLEVYVFLFSVFHFFFEGNLYIHLFASGTFVFHILSLKGIIISIISMILNVPIYDLINDYYLYIMVNTCVCIAATGFLTFFDKTCPIEDILGILKNNRLTCLFINLHFLINIMLILVSSIYHIDSHIMWLSSYHLIVSSIFLISFYILLKYFIVENKAQNALILVNDRESFFIPKIAGEQSLSSDLIYLSEYTDSNSKYPFLDNYKRYCQTKGIKITILNDENIPEKTELFASAYISNILNDLIDKKSACLSELVIACQRNNDSTIYSLRLIFQERINRSFILNLINSKGYSLSRDMLEADGGIINYELSSNNKILIIGLMFSNDCS